MSLALKKFILQSTLFHRNWTLFGPHCFSSLALALRSSTQPIFPKKPRPFPKKQKLKQQFERMCKEVKECLLRKIPADIFFPRLKISRQRKEKIQKINFVKLRNLFQAPSTRTSFFLEFLGFQFFSYLVFFQVQTIIYMCV